MPLTSVPADWRSLAAEFTQPTPFAARIWDTACAYFHEHPQGYELDASIRAVVTFHQASVLDLRLLDELSPYDVIFCRNLLIYLEVSAHGASWHRSTGCWRPMACSSLATPIDWALFGEETKFISINEPGLFAYRRAAQGAPRLTRFPARSHGRLELSTSGVTAPAAPVFSHMRSTNPQHAPVQQDSAVVAPAESDRASVTGSSRRISEQRAVCRGHRGL